MSVSVEKGVLIPSGIVENYFKKVLAEKVTKKVIGVKVVAEKILINTPGSKIVTDVDITTALIATLKLNSAITKGAIHVIIENAEVTFEETAEWHFQKISTQKAVENLVGICDITKNIRLERKIVASDVKERIANAFERKAIIDSSNLKVEVLGDKVILLSTVSSLSEKMDIEKTAWASPRVMEVEKHLSIDSGIIVY